MADIVPSEELREFMVRLMAAIGAGDLETVRELFIADPKLLCIGTDEREWFTGATGPEVFTRQVQQVGGIQFVHRNPVAYRSGNCGWVADQITMKFPDGEEVRMRISLTMVIDRGHWRVAHFHSSMPIANETITGHEVITSLEGLEQSVRDEKPDVGPASAPDGTVTILFTDIESSTVLMQRLGDTEFVRMLAWHDRIIRSIAEEQGGFVVKSQGDGFMLAFPSAAYALRASLLMHEQIKAGFNGLPVRIRTGLHAGEAIKQNDDFYGSTVVIAARISALALGGEILASDLVHALARSLGTFQFGERREVTLKGLDGDFAVYPVLGAS
jgi:class 3 adenylate cyclase